MLRTLLEIHGVLVKLNSSDEFKAALRLKGPTFVQQFDGLRRDFERQHKLLKMLRNDIGGHVRHVKLEEALNEMPPGKWGFLELGEILRKTHYRFAGELLLEMQLAGLSDSQREAEIERLIQETAELIPVYALMHLVFEVYASSRGLHK